MLLFRIITEKYLIDYYLNGEMLSFNVFVDSVYAGGNCEKGLSIESELEWIKAVIRYKRDVLYFEDGIILENVSEDFKLELLKRFELIKKYATFI